MSSSESGRPAHTSRPASRRRSDAGGLLTLVHGTFAAVGTIYLATRSVAVTILGCIVAMMLAFLVVIRRR